LQAWFARTDHPAAKDPNFLYAASNVGSFLALVSYPIVIEPFVRLGDQAWSWSIAFGFLIALLAACGALPWRAPDDDSPAGGAAGLEGRGLLGRARGGARGPPGRGDGAHFDRCGGGAAPLGPSACALSLDLRHRIRAPADRPALAPGRHATRVHYCARCRDHLPPRQDHRRAARPAPLGFLRQRADVPRRARAHAARA